MIALEKIKEGFTYYELYESNNKPVKFKIIKELELEGYVICELHINDVTSRTVTVFKGLIQKQGFENKINVLNIIKSSIERQIDELATELQEIQVEIDQLND